MTLNYDNLQPLCPKFLEIIKWIPDGENTEKKLKVVESLAPKWENVAAIFNMNRDQIKAIQNPGSGMTPEQCLSEVLGRWGKNGDKDYPYTWDGLRTLLVDLECKVVAEQLRGALTSQRSNVRGNLCYPYLLSGQIKNSEDTKKGSWSNIKIFGTILLFIVGVFFISHIDGNFVHQLRITSASRTLPYISDNFVGRENELEEILTKLNFKFTETRIVSILGSPGFGKSTLAIQLGHRLVDQGVYVHYVNLNEFVSENIEVFIAEKILESSDVITKKATFDRLLKWARGRSSDTLLILDNCDNAFRSVISLANFVNGIGDLVQSSKNIKVITTSREMILLHTHHHYRYKVYQLSPKAAISLLNNKLPPEVPLKQKSKEKIAEYTGNVPLALHIVGSLLSLEDPPSPEKVIKGLKSDAVHFLSPEYFPMHLRIDASISLSYQYLDDNLQIIALFLSLFSGSFSKHALIDISTQLQNNDKSSVVPVSITQNDLRALVDRSLLEYNKRIHRYQYHRLIREFLRKKLQLIKDSKRAFLNELKTYFLKQLHLHTVGFDRRYINSLKFLDSERHNIYTVLTVLTMPKSLPRHLVLMTIDYVTKAIDVGYLTCRFTNEELLQFLSPTLVYLDYNVLSFQQQSGLNTITDFGGTTWTLKEYYQRIYIQLVITCSDLVAKIQGEELAINIMETRKMIVDVLLHDKSYRAKENSGEKSYSAENSHQEHIVITEKSPTKFFANGEINPSQDPDTVPLATRAQRRLFYNKLSSHHLALGDHSKVIECQLKIMDDISKCEQENCSYREIGIIYLNMNNHAEAIHFLELSLQHEKHNFFTEIDILSNLFYLYSNLREWPWTVSEKEQHTLERIMSICYKIREQEDIIIFYEWKLIMKIIVLLNKINKDDFLEERLFSVISNPNAQFQLKPKDALSVVKIIEEINNSTKIVLWGSLLFTPFENYNNFSIEETIVTLQIKLSISKAHIKLWNISKGLDEMERIHETISYSHELQDHIDIPEIHSTACFYLIIRLKYILPCYQAFLKESIVNFLYDLQIKLLYIVFVPPFRFRSYILNRQNYNNLKIKQSFYAQSTAVAFEKSTPTALGDINQDFFEPFALTFRDKVVFFVSNIWDRYISTYFWRFIEVSDICIRFSINVITVYIRLKLIASLILAVLATIFALLSFFENILALLYMSIFTRLSLPQSLQELLITIFDILIYLRIPINLVSTFLLLTEHTKAIFVQIISFACSYNLIKYELCLVIRVFCFVLIWHILSFNVITNKELSFIVKLRFIVIFFVIIYFIPSFVVSILFVYVTFL